LVKDPTHVEGPIVIIGGGPAGLGAAYMLHRSGFDEWVLYERDEVVGGLARSFLDKKGFTWDVGGHVAFSHYDLFTRVLDEALGPTGWLEHERESWIRLLDTWVPYPFQNNIHRLPPKERAECIAGLIQSALERRDDDFSDFDDFIVRTFGRGVADLFMRPYNHKVWAYHPSKLDAGWIEDRVSAPDPVRVARNMALGVDDCDWGPNSTFRFPKRGGTGAIWRALAQELPKDKIMTGCEVVGLDAAGRKLDLSNGTTQPYGTLISTMPLDRIAAISGRKEWVEMAAGLTYSSVHVVGVALQGTRPPLLDKKCWMYFPESNCPFYRVTHFSFYSPNNVDDISKHWSLLCEVSESPEKSVDESRVVQDTVDGLVAAGLLDSASRVFHTWSHRVEYAYPTPTKVRDRVLDSIQPELRKENILSRGRFGGWRYEVGNMDHSFMQGLEAAAHLLQGVDEVTLWHPEIVNAGFAGPGVDVIRP
jgi:protoporphyrinogen oxidase